MNALPITIAYLIQDVTALFFWNKAQDFFDYLERRDFYKSDEILGRKSYVNRDPQLDISIDLNSENRSYINFMSILINVWENPDELSEDEYFSQISSFSAKFKITLDRLIQNFGEPTILSNIGEPSFLEYYDAIKVAIWKRGHAAIFLKLEHQDKEIPIILDVVLVVYQLIVDGSKISIEPEPEASKMLALPIIT